MKKGDIVLVRFPFSNLLAAKLRPALVLIADDDYGDVCLAFITSRLEAESAFTLRLAEKAEGFSKTGLKTSSTVRLNKIVTLHKDIVIGRLGRLSNPTLSLLNQKLRRIFKVGT